jgi:hypothetical protein
LNKKQFDKVLADWAEENRTVLDKLVSQPGECIPFSRFQAVAVSQELLSAGERQHLQKCRRCRSVLRTFQAALPAMEVLEIHERYATVKGAEYARLAKAQIVTIFDSDSGLAVASARVNRGELVAKALPEVSRSPIGKVSIPLDDSLPDELVRSDRVKLGKILLRVQ